MRVVHTLGVSYKIHCYPHNSEPVVKRKRPIKRIAFVKFQDKTRGKCVDVACYKADSFHEIKSVKIDSIEQIALLSK